MDISKIIFSDVNYSCKNAVVGGLYFFGNNTDDLEREIELGIPHTLSSITEKGTFIPENCNKAFSVLYPGEITVEEECIKAFNSFYKIWRKKPYTLFSLYDTRDGGYYEGIITMVDPNDYSFKFGDMIYEINELIDEEIELKVLEDE